MHEFSGKLVTNIIGSKNVHKQTGDSVRGVVVASGYNGGHAVSPRLANQISTVADAGGRNRRAPLKSDHLSFLSFYQNA